LASSTKPSVHAQKFGFTLEIPAEPYPQAVGAPVVKITVVGDAIVESPGVAVVANGVVAVLAVVANVVARVVAGVNPPKTPQAHPLPGDDSVHPHLPTQASAILTDEHDAMGRRQNEWSGSAPSQPKHVLHRIGHENLVKVAEQSMYAAPHTAASSTSQLQMLAPGA
jgi:hypothetical protein